MFLPNDCSIVVMPSFRPLCDGGGQRIRGHARRPRHSPVMSSDVHRGPRRRVNFRTLPCTLFVGVPCERVFPKVMLLKNMPFDEPNKFRQLFHALEAAAHFALSQFGTSPLVSDEEREIALYEAISHCTP